MRRSIIAAVVIAVAVGVSACGSSERAGQVADAARVQMVEEAANQLQPEDYLWPRCDESQQVSCVQVAERESVMVLSDGDVIPLNHEQAMAMVGEE